MDEMTVKLRKVKQAIQNIEDTHKGSPLEIDNIDITFEYLVASFFPGAFDVFQKNVDKLIESAFQAGYEAALKDASQSQNNLNAED